MSNLTVDGDLNQMTTQRSFLIGKGFELTPDPDLVMLPAPTITQATVDEGTIKLQKLHQMQLQQAKVIEGVPPHRDRGPCIACHLILP